MNVDNGHLIRLGVTGSGRSLSSTLGEMAVLGRNYFQVPTELQHEAERELGGKNETYVDLKSVTPLATWAAKKRSERAKKKDKRRTAKQSSRRKRS